MSRTKNQFLNFIFEHFEA